MHIWDKDVLEKMAEVEWPDRGQEFEGAKREDYLRRIKDARKDWMLLTMRDDECSFIGALKHLVKIQHEHIEVNTTSGLTPIEPPTCAVFVIYGDCGWNRWMVTFDGEIRFSRHHSTELKAELAKKAGFRLW